MGGGPSGVANTATGYGPLRRHHSGFDACVGFCIPEDLSELHIFCSYSGTDLNLECEERSSKTPLTVRCHCHSALIVSCHQVRPSANRASERGDTRGRRPPTFRRIGTRHAYFRTAAAAAQMLRAYDREYPQGAWR